MPNKNTKVCRECQFESGEHSLACPKHKEQDLSKFINPECKKCWLLKSTVDRTGKKCIKDGVHDFGKECTCSPEDMRQFGVCVCSKEKYKDVCDKHGNPDCMECFYTTRTETPCTTYAVAPAHLGGGSHTIHKGTCDECKVETTKRNIQKAVDVWEKAADEVLEFPKDIPMPVAPTTLEESWENDLAELLDENKPTKIRDFIRSLLTKERERVVEVAEGMKSLECKCPYPVKWEMNRCLICRKVGIDQRSANDVLSDFIEKLK